MSIRYEWDTANKTFEVGVVTEGCYPDGDEPDRAASVGAPPLFDDIVVTKPLAFVLGGRTGGGMVIEGTLDQLRNLVRRLSRKLDHHDPALDTSSSASRQHYIDTGHYVGADGTCECDDNQPAVYCGCGQEVVPHPYLHGEWVHRLNDVFCGDGDHETRPAGQADIGAQDRRDALRSVLSTVQEFDRVAQERSAVLDGETRGDIDDFDELYEDAAEQVALAVRDVLLGQPQEVLYVTDGADPDAPLHVACPRCLDHEHMHLVENVERYGRLSVIDASPVDVIYGWEASDEEVDRTALRCGTCSAFPLTWDPAVVDVQST